MSDDATATLRSALERFSGPVPPDQEAAARAAFLELKAALNRGTVRAAERGADGRWRANAWVKAGILLGFRLGRIQPAATGGPFPFYDKDTYPLRRIGAEDGIRIVPGGSAIRDGCYVAPGTLLTGGTTVFDLVHDRVYRRDGDRPLEIPAGAVVVPGTRPVRSGPGRDARIGLYAPVIVKYRDEKTDTAVRLEELLR